MSLLGALFGVTTVAQTLRMVADGVVRVPATDRGGHHVGERVLPVRPRGVGMEVTAKIGERDEHRQLVPARCWIHSPVC